MKTIIVPTDFSAAAKAAVKLATNLANQFNSTIILLHVIEGIEEGSFNVEGEAASTISWEDKLFTMKLIEKSRKLLNQATSDILETGVKAVGVLRIGNPFHGIESVITEQKADVVIMGTRGSSGIEEVLVGSNTEKVVRRSTCPVISVNQFNKIESINSIVWATSLKNEDLDVPTVVRKLMDLNGVTVHLVRVNTPGLFIADTFVRNKLEMFARKLKLKKYTVNVINDFNEEDGIRAFAAQAKADLIALSTHGRRGLDHFLSGSVAEDVVNHSNRPVMTYLIGKRKVKATQRRKPKVAQVVL